MTRLAAMTHTRSQERGRLHLLLLSFSIHRDYLHNINKMAAAIKMDELLVSWLGSDTVYENVQQLMETYRAAEAPSLKDQHLEKDVGDDSSQSSPRGVIPPFYPKGEQTQRARRRMLTPHNTTSFPSTGAAALDDGTWLPLPTPIMTH